MKDPAKRIELKDIKHHRWIVRNTTPPSAGKENTA
jgi:hypothetical protein